MRRSIASLASTALVLALVAGCGGGSGKVEVNTYADSVCSAITTWREQLTAASTALVQQTNTMTDLTNVRQKFVAFFDGAITSTDEMLTAVEEAGVPDIENDDVVATALQKELRKFRPILVNARNTARRLPVDDEVAFATQAQRLGSRFQIELGGLATMFQALDEKYGTPELRAAAENSASCKAL